MKDELRTLILAHYEKRPCMEIQDVYKLLYQSILGLGHLLTNTDAAKLYLYKELDGLSEYDGDEPLTEDISLVNKMVRVNLRAFKARNLSGDALFDAMLATEKLNTSSMDDFIAFWTLFIQFVDEGKLPFDPGLLQDFNKKVDSLNYPAVHHSTSYQALYKPSYRIIGQHIFNGSFK